MKKRAVFLSSSDNNIPNNILIGGRRNISVCNIYQLQLNSTTSPQQQQQQEKTVQNPRYLPMMKTKREKSTFIHLTYPLECPLPYEPDDQYAPSQSEHYTMQRMDGANPHSTFSFSV